MGITHIKYSWVNFQFKTVTQKYFFNQLLQHKQWRPSRQRPRQFPGEASWLFLVRDLYFAKIFFSCFSFIRGLSYPTHSGVLLQLRKYDDLPHLLHEVRILASNQSRMITWPKWWPLIGQNLSCDPNTGLWLVNTVPMWSLWPASDLLLSFANHWQFLSPYLQTTWLSRPDLRRLHRGPECLGDDPGPDYASLRLHQQVSILASDWSIKIT